MRCAFESRQERLNLYPFPGLKVINIRGCALLALDLIIIGNFVSKLADDNRLLELALRDYPLDRTGLMGKRVCSAFCLIFCPTPFCSTLDRPDAVPAAGAHRDPLREEAV